MIGLINAISVHLTPSSSATCIVHMHDCMHACILAHSIEHELDMSWRIATPIVLNAQFTLAENIAQTNPTTWLARKLKCSTPWTPCKYTPIYMKVISKHIVIIVCQENISRGAPILIKTLKAGAPTYASSCKLVTSRRHTCVHCSYTARMQTKTCNDLSLHERKENSDHSMQMALIWSKAKQSSQTLVEWH